MVYLCLGSLWDLPVFTFRIHSVKVLKYNLKKRMIVLREGKG